jgi:hypothetical protein
VNTIAEGCQSNSKDGKQAAIEKSDYVAYMKVDL